MQTRLATVLALALTSTAHADPEPFDGTTMAGQALGGALGSLGGLVGGGALGYGVDRLVGSKSGWVCSQFMCLGAMAGFVGGLTVGTQVAGDLADGTGRWWGTALGTVGGVGASFGLLYASEALDLDLPGPLYALATVTFLLGGPVLGYHLTANEPRSEPVMFTIGRGRF